MKSFKIELSYQSPKYGSKILEGFEINIVIPTGIIIVGRDKDLNKDKKRLGSNSSPVDIITYDYLLNRLKVIHDQFQQAT